MSQLGGLVERQKRRESRVISESSLDFIAGQALTASRLPRNLRPLVLDCMLLFYVLLFHRNP
jgi:hypothetical protein